MRRPRWSHSFTKGVQFIRKSLGLATKGVQDQKLGGKPIPYTQAYERIITIVGKKEFSTKLKLNIRGLFAQAVFSSYKIYAKKTTTFNRINKIKGIISKSNDREFRIKGTKQFLYKNTNKVLGKRLFNFNKDLIAKGTKSFDFQNRTLVKGIKQINRIEQKTIKAKKDIMPILVALDLIK